MSFKDHFSAHADRYARYRPDYPNGLFEYLASLTSRRQYALDCATGNGQAAVGLATHFDRVIGTDGSIQQLQHARAHPQVIYVCNLAEQPAFNDHSMDLVVAAQAAHWFDHERFYREVRRVLTPDGAIAVWTYAMASTEPEIDRITRNFYSDVVGRYWPPERRYIEAAYENLPFPFQDLKSPEFQLEAQWDLDTFLGYIGTWSAVRQYTKAVSRDPIPALRAEIEPHWNSANPLRSIVWPLHLRVGRP